MTNPNSAPQTGGAPTPPQEEPPKNAYAAYVPHDLKYSTAFEDAIMAIVNNPPSESQDSGIRIIPEDSSEIPVEGISVKADAISWQSLPEVREEELPLPLEDGRRVFRSPVRGVRVTHPGGYLHGGPGLDPEMDTFAEDFLQRNAANTNDAQTLRAAQQDEIAQSIGELKQRMRERQRAIESNERIEKELKRMREEHEMEMKVHRQLAEKRKAKKEAKERERAGKGG
ncbi:Hypothetical predicted protein [Lecanosticta acicola]|uniref:Uncharacterized protein n=1 Tax=Lecanosticta acicola TaxID=111012 RepID=A0AAI8YWJ5_9PEZI|nr:Hypothetical predicted protein [Lecanosticta acicola]